MEIKCFKCKSKDIMKQGFRNNNLGKKQKYLCNNCRAWFIVDDGFKKMRYRKKDIARAISLHNKGLSLFDVKDHLWQHDGIKVTKRTISQWIKKYSIFLKSNKSARADIKRKTAS